MSIGKSSIKRAIASSGKTIPESVKETVNNTEKKAEEKKMTEVKSKSVKKTAAKTGRGAKKSAVAAKKVIAGTNEQVLASIQKREGLNDHFGLSTPLPTFLL